MTDPAPPAANPQPTAPVFEFRKPTKFITSPAELDKFTHSDTCRLFVTWLTEISAALRGRKLSDSNYPVTEPIKKIVAILVKLESWVDEIPPIEQPMRFGNKAFRIWMERVENKGVELMLEFLPPNLHPAAPELAEYFINSFGNKTRIDYGTGHEAAFATWMYCLEQIGLSTPEDRVALVFQVFQEYLTLVRKFQRRYVLEPAGSRGVWSLDDHQFLCFYFGSAQLMGHPHILPKSVRQKDIIENFSKDYIYFQAVDFVLSVKTGPFSEHSPVLNSIAEVPHWEKVNQGLMKMYLSEVLGKFPIMQHHFFGSIFPFPTPLKPKGPL